MAVAHHHYSLSSHTRLAGDLDTLSIRFLPHSLRSAYSVRDAYSVSQSWSAISRSYRGDLGDSALSISPIFFGTVDNKVKHS
jgi:hypothetical protein